MPQVLTDVCDHCGRYLTEPKSGLVINGSHLDTRWAGESDHSDPFFNNTGTIEPFNGKVCLVICCGCLLKIFKAKKE